MALSCCFFHHFCIRGVIVCTLTHCYVRWRRACWHSTRSLSRPQIMDVTWATLNWRLFSTYPTRWLAKRYKTLRRFCCLLWGSFHQRVDSTSSYSAHVIMMPLNCYEFHCNWTWDPYCTVSLASVSSLLLSSVNSNDMLAFKMSQWLLNRYFLLLFPNICMSTLEATAWYPI